MCFPSSQPSVLHKMHLSRWWYLEGSFLGQLFLQGHSLWREDEPFHTWREGQQCEDGTGDLGAPHLLQQGWQAVLEAAVWAGQVSPGVGGSSPFVLRNAAGDSPGSTRPRLTLAGL